MSTNPDNGRMSTKPDMVIVFDLTMSVVYERSPEEAVNILFSARGVPLFWSDPVKTFQTNMEHLPSYLDACRGDGVFLVPPAIRINRAAPKRRQTTSIRPSRKGLFDRDDCTCQYCGTSENQKDLTLDHVMPVSRGGGFTWTNLVAACKTCNVRKGNRTPEEAKMPLAKQPFRPSPGYLLMKLQKLWEDESQ